MHSNTLCNKRTKMNSKSLLNVTENQRRRFMFLETKNGTDKHFLQRNHLSCIVATKPHSTVRLSTQGCLQWKVMLLLRNARKGTLILSKGSYSLFHQSYLSQFVICEAPDEFMDLPDPSYGLRSKVISSLASQSTQYAYLSKYNSSTLICKTTPKLNTLPSRLIAAHKVPPVAMRSSITSARSPAWTAPTCISILSVPYSNEYSSEITSPAKTSKIVNHSWNPLWHPNIASQVKSEMTWAQEYKGIRSSFTPLGHVHNTKFTRPANELQIICSSTIITHASLLS